MIHRRSVLPLVFLGLLSGCASKKPAQALTELAQQLSQFLAAAP